MSNEAELGQAIDNATQANAIVSHPLFVASLATLRELTVERFESLGFSQVLEMQECNVRLNLIEEFESNLVTVIQNGDFAYKALEDIQTHQQEMNNGR